MSKYYQQCGDEHMDDDEMKSLKRIDKLNLENTTNNNNIVSNNNNNNRKTSTAASKEFVSSPRAEESTSHHVLQDDLLDGNEIFSLWLRSFATNDVIAEQKWQEFRIDTKARYEEFDRILKKIELGIYINSDNDVFFDVAYLQERKDNVEAVLAEIDTYNKEFNELTKQLEEFCQFLPKDVYRKRLDLVVRNLRGRYFNLVQDLYKKREVLRWTIPRFQIYRSIGSEIKSWLDCVESRSKSFLVQGDSNTNGEVEVIADEIVSKKDTYEEFLNAGNGILDVEHGMRMTHLEEDINDVTCRWDFLCEKIETCLNRSFLEDQHKSVTKFDELNNTPRSDVEKIDRHIKDEYQQCTCCTKFAIEKVEDGRYTFGTTKTIRLLRIHGNSIVVRVGGGWEYLYNFLHKVDPCRAQQLADNPEKAIQRIKYLSGVSLIPADQQDHSFTMSVQRMYKSSYSPHIKNKPATPTSYQKTRAPSVDQLDSAGESLSSLSMSTASSSSTSSIPHAIDTSKNKPLKNSTTVQRTPSDRYSSLSAGTRGRKTKMNRSTGNLTKKPVVRRVSLMDRQGQFQGRKKQRPASASILD